MSRGLAIVVAIAVLAPNAAAAQPDDDPALRRHRFTISGGLSWLGGYALGGKTATLRRNEIGTASPSSFALFRTDASIEQAPAVEARIGYALTRGLAVELGGVYGRPQLALNVTGDAENTAVIHSAEHVSQYAIDVGAVWQIPRVRFGSHIRPYVTGGGGYLRQLYADRTAVETGRMMHVGGGIRYWLRGGDTSHRPLGLRIEMRVQSRTGGVELEDRARTFPVANIFGFFGF